MLYDMNSYFSTPVDFVFVSVFCFCPAELLSRVRCRPVSICSAWIFDGNLQSKLEDLADRKITAPVSCYPSCKRRQRKVRLT